MRWLRRLVILGFIGVAGTMALRAVQARKSKPQVGPPEWPPLERNDSAASATIRPIADHRPAPSVTPDDHEVDDDTVKATWLAPVDGVCPAGYPIKANNSSHIFHVPGGRFYARTIAERCYADPADAERDGYRRAKA